MASRRAVFISLAALVSIATLATPAIAGGRPDRAPRSLEVVLAVGLLGFGAVFFALVAVGAYRRRHP